MILFTSNKTKSLTTLALAVATVVMSYGQSPLRNVIPPSPDVQTFQKYGNIPVSPYTGVPEINVPIYTIKAREITVPVTLNYHASGIKVAEESGRVGLGWALNAGGVISRTVINRDDFDQSSFGFLDVNRSPDRIFPGDTISNHIGKPLQWGVIPELINPDDESHVRQYYLENAIDGQDYDFEPDHFSFNFMDNNGKFIVRQNEYHQLQAIIEKKQRIYILPERIGSTTPPTIKWTVKTADGTTYIFDQPENYRRNGPGETEHTSAWYLTSITAPSGEKVFFEYETVGNQFINPVGSFSETVQAYMESCTGNQHPCSSIVTDPTPQATPGQTYSMVRLKTITWTNGKIDFLTGPRVDVEGDVRIEQIRISSKNPLTGAYTLKDVYEFGYEYFETIASTNTFPAAQPIHPDDPLDYKLFKRLKLVSLTRRPPNDQDPNLLNKKQVFTWKFEYFDKDLPAKTSFSRDHWGYFNGSGATTLIPPHSPIINAPTALKQAEGVMSPLRDANFTPQVAGTLQKIYYPTGGSTEFTFEANTYDIGASGGGTPQNPTAPYKGTEYFDMTRSGTGSQTKTGTLDLNDEYRSGEPGHYTYTQADISVTFLSDNNDVPLNCKTTAGGNYTISITDSNNLPIKNVSAGGQSGSECLIPTLDCMTCQTSMMGNYVTIHVKATMPRGTFNISASMPAGNTFSSVHVKVDYDVDPVLNPPTINYSDRFAYAGGLRVAKIVDYDPESENEYNTKTYLYHRKEGTDIRSNGILTVWPKYTYYDVSYQRVPDGNGGYVYCLDCAYIIRQSESFMPSTGSMGSVVGYSTVTEFHGSGNIAATGANGKIVYTFNNAPETGLTYRHPINSDYIMRPPAVATRPDLLNGTMKTKTEYDFQDDIVHQTTYDYTYSFMRYDYGMEIRKIPMPGIAQNEDPSYYANPQRPNKSFLNLYFYPIMSAFVFNRSTTEVFDKRVSKKTDYEYDKYNLLVTKSTEKSSDNHIIETTMKYPGEYDLPSTNPVGKMGTLSKYMVGIPVETKVVDVTADLILTNNVNVFDFFNSGQHILPREVLDLKAPVSTDDNLFTGYDPTTAYSPDYFRNTATADYNAKGNPKFVQKNFDVPVSYLWDANDYYPIAQITNAKLDQVSIETFEQAASSSVAGVTAHTGKSYRAVPYNVTFTPAAGTSYLIEYWYYSGGWIHKRIDYSGPITITDGIAVDDIRVYPKNAMVKSFTYESFGEMTSSISESGITQIYDYDTFSRLLRIRNEKGDIEKQFTYHYKKY